MKRILVKRVPSNGPSRFYSSKRPTFENQEKLPRLPIPKLEDTLKTYEKSLEPFLTPEELQGHSSVLKSFESGLGPVLQKRLIQYGKTAKNSWLEQFWLENAYLKYREPSMINSNWWCEFVDSPEQPRDHLIKPPPPGVISSFQVKRAAGLISNFLNFNDMLNDQTFPPETIKGTPLCMGQYKNVFGTSRVSGEKMDSIVHQYPTIHKHIIVMVKEQFFKVQVYGGGNSRVPLKELERLLFLVAKESLETSKEPNVGILTAGHRDNTFQGINLLKTLSEKNKENFKSIDDALLVLCLDDHSSKKNIDRSHLQVFHNQTGKNRYFDKALQIIVANNGRAGLNGEHSPADAVVPGIIVDYVLKNEPATDPVNAKDEPLAYPEKLIWTSNEQVQKILDTAQQQARDLINNTESCLFQTDIYGSRFIKEIAKASPDSFVQIALQLAYYRLHKQPTAVYESASSRLFAYGRTETGRSLSSESLEFCKAFDNDDVLYADKKILFDRAIKTQNTYMKEASVGKGIDRHLMGLRLMLKPDETTDFFSDPSFSKSQYFRLSTSNMSPGKYFYGGFGPVVEEGYGINYAIDKDILKFSISSRKSCKQTNSFKFRDMLERVIIDLFILFPKRSEVWGYDWKLKHQEEKKVEYRVGEMRRLSDELKKKQEVMAERYRDK